MEEETKLEIKIELDTKDAEQKLERLKKQLQEILELQERI